MRAEKDEFIKVEKGDFKMVESDGETFWYFQKKIGSIMESFTVTLIHDGTVVLSGDYNVLAFRREYFPKDMERLLGFPNSKIDTRYFAEKVQGDRKYLTITDWDEDRARFMIHKHYHEAYEHPEDLKGRLRNPPDLETDKYFDEMTIEEQEMAKENLVDAIMDEIGSFHTEEQMANALIDFERDSDLLECEFGRNYTSQFFWQFEVLKYWGDWILERLENGRPLNEE